MVFISHRQADSNLSAQIQEYLDKFEVPSYLDINDSKIHSPGDLTSHIIQQLKRCSHIIAVFSINTKGSYWVPFELGAAYEANLNIATYVHQSPRDTVFDIPEYLNAFPIMRHTLHLEDFAKKYKNSNLVLQEGRLVERSAFAKAASSSRRSADVYIEEMKAILRQG